MVLRALIFVACRAALARAQSQGAQDCIIAEIFDRIGVTNGYYVEIGFNSPTFEGGTGANTWALHRRVQKRENDAYFEGATLRKGYHV